MEMDILEEMVKAVVMKVVEGDMEDGVVIDLEEVEEDTVAVEEIMEAVEEDMAETAEIMEAVVVDMVKVRLEEIMVEAEEDIMVEEEIMAVAVVDMEMEEMALGETMVDTVLEVEEV